MPVGISTVDNTVLLYPNPTSTQFELILPDFNNSSYELLDNLGRSVASGNPVSERTTIDTQSLPAGIYLLQLQTPQGVIAQKLIRQ